MLRSDAGAQDTSAAFRTTLAELGIRESMGSVADTFDNAAAESWFATLKTEIGTPC